MLNFHNDDNIKILYDRKVDADYQELEAIGATESLTLRELGFTPDNTNSIFVSKDGDDSNAGTQASPVLTIERASALITASKSNIVILDSGEYIENSIDFSANCTGLFSLLGETPKIIPATPLIGKTAGNYAWGSLATKGSTDIGSGSYSAVAVLDNGNVVSVFRSAVSPNPIAGRLLNNNGELQKDGVALLSEAHSGSSQFLNAFAVKGGIVVCKDYFNSSASYMACEYGIFDNDLNLIFTKKFPSQRAGVAGCKINEDTFVLTSYSISGVHYIKIKNDGTELTGWISLSAVRPHSQVDGFTVNSDGLGGFIIGFKVYNVWENRVIYVDKDGVIKFNDSIISGGGYCSPVVDNNKVIIATSNSGLQVHIQERKLSDFSTVTAPVLVGTYTSNTGLSTTSNNIHLRITENKAIALVSGRSLYFLAPDFSLIGAVETMKNSYHNNSMDYDLLNDRIFIHLSVTAGGLPADTMELRIKGGFITDFLNFQSSVEINGIIFDSPNIKIKRYLRTAGSLLKFRWCDVLNITRGAFTDANHYTLRVLTSTAAANEIKNSRFHNNDSGLHITSNSNLIYRSQFAKAYILPAIHIIGENTEVNHCDFVFCKVGVKLNSNSADDIIRNSTFFKNINADIEAETPVELNHSLFTGILINCTLGTKVLQVNPLYINDGFNDITKINLNLKRKLLGFLIDSAGLGLADDGGDAGSHKTVILGVEETWKEIKVPKGEMKRKFGPAWAVSNIFDSGRMKSQKKGMIETIEIDWSKGLRSEFVDKIIQLNTCDSSEVRLYPDPATHPLDYGTYTFEYQEIDLDPGTNRLSNRGYKGVKMIFKRSVEDMVI
jgi:hypothetical protein